MAGAGLQIEVLDAAAARAAVAELGKVLADCVNGGASVSFMLPFGQAEAEAYFHKVADQVARGETVLLAARLHGRIVGTVQLGLDTPPNQPHRADVKKMLVRRAARRRGVGAAVLAAAEREAARLGRSLLVLDTVRGAAGERLYLSQGWTRAGVIPDYALLPDGGLVDTVYFWKRVGGSV